MSEGVVLDSEGEHGVRKRSGGFQVELEVCNTHLIDRDVVSGWAGWRRRNDLLPRLRGKRGNLNLKWHCCCRAELQRTATEPLAESAQLEHPPGAFNTLR